MSIDWNKIIIDHNFSWQGPVITEETACRQEKNNGNYIGFPWAEVIDRRFNIHEIHNFINSKLTINKSYISCCQHIYFRKLLPLFESLNIKILYTPHKVIGENTIGNIHIKAMPLYAVNVEDQKRNSFFLEKDVVNVERKYLYCFMGGHQFGYISDIRPKIFTIHHISDAFIKNTGDWHFNAFVYDVKQHSNGITEKKSPDDIEEEHTRKTELYNRILLSSRFSLCPSGSGPNSIRFWESLAVGAIPILLSDTLDLPPHDLWKDAILRVPEKDVEKIPEMLQSIENEENMRRNCLKIYNFFKNNFILKNSNLLIT